MPPSRPLIRALVLLLLFTQYAALAHAAEHHLFDNPLQSAAGQCDGDHLQSPSGSSLPQAAPSVVPLNSAGAPARTAVADPHQPPLRRFQSRAPPQSP